MKVRRMMEAPCPQKDFRFKSSNEVGALRRELLSMQGYFNRKIRSVYMQEESLAVVSKQEGVK